MQAKPVNPIRLIEMLIGIPERRHKISAIKPRIPIVLEVNFGYYL